MASNTRKIALGMAGTACLLGATACGNGSAGAVRNPHGLALVHERLSQVVPELDALNDPKHAHSAGRATFAGCEPDESGDVSEPQVSRGWDLDGSAYVDDALKVSPGGREAGRAIAAQLVADGWKGSTTLDNDSSTDLYKVFDDERIHLGIQVFNDVVNVWADVGSRHVCRGTS